MKYKNESEKEMVIPAYGTVELRRNVVVVCSWDIAGLWNKNLVRTEKITPFM